MGLGNQAITDTLNHHRTTAESIVATTPALNCYLCGGFGNLVYQGLRDRLFSAPGVWKIRRCADSRCGLMWLDPKPLESELGKLYADYYTHADPERGSPARRLFKYIRDGYLNRLCGYNGTNITQIEKVASLLLDFYPPKRSDFDFPMRYLRLLPKGRLLDVGCGAGLTLELAQNSGWAAEGIDVDRKAVENACGKGLRAKVGILSELEFPAGSFDAVVMNHVIEHLYDPAQSLRECRRILRTGGHLLVNTPNTQSLGHQWFGEHWVAIDSPRHLHLFPSKSLRTLVERAGFDEITVDSAMGRAAGVLSASKSIRDTSRFDMSQTPKLYGRFTEMVEWAVGFWRDSAGEELRLVARKPPFQSTNAGI